MTPSIEPIQEACRYLDRGNPKALTSAQQYQISRLIAARVSITTVCIRVYENFVIGCRNRCNLRIEHDCEPSQMFKHLSMIGVKLVAGRLGNSTFM